MSKENSTSCKWLQKCTKAFVNPESQLGKYTYLPASIDFEVSWGLGRNVLKDLGNSLWIVCKSLSNLDNMDDLGTITSFNAQLVIICFMPATTHEVNL